LGHLRVAFKLTLDDPSNSDSGIFQETRILKVTRPLEYPAGSEGDPR
jgi:hypothetical protein